MAFIFANPNPNGSYVGDCVIRALSLALDKRWQDVYIDLATYGFILGDMPSSNRVWSEYLKSQGYSAFIVPDTCPLCITIKDFCREHPQGKYIVATGTHVVCIKDGNYMDTWDSGDEAIIYYWKEV